MGKYLAALLAVALLGCAGPPRPTAGDSVIVFILPGMTSTTGAYQPSYGATPSVSLHDVSTPERRIVGILGIGQKLGYRVSPGKHEFMLLNKGSTDFMEANVGAGKTYYVVIQLLAQPGYDQRYGFKPVRPGDFESGLFARWETNLSYVERPEAWQRWSEANDPSVASRLKQFRPAWAKQGPDERRLKTIEVSDGR
jgi:hypothetical protein